MRFREIILEYDRDKTIDKFNEKILLRHQADSSTWDLVRKEMTELRDNGIDRSSDWSAKHTVKLLVQHLEKMADPTVNKKYMIWILKNWTSEKFKIEDASRVRVTLEKFEKIKPVLNKQNIGADIGQYDWYTLQDLIEEHFQDNSESGKEKRRKELEAVKKETIIIYEGPDGKLLIPKTERASCFWGRGTRWCTAATDSENYFSNYTSVAPIYIWISSDHEKYQFWMHYAGDPQFMDAKDRPLSQKQFDELRNNHSAIRELISSLEKEALPKDPFDYEGNRGAFHEFFRTYIKQYRKGRRWESAEYFLARHPDLDFRLWYIQNCAKTRVKEFEKIFQDRLDHEPYGSASYAYFDRAFNKYKKLVGLPIK